MIENDFRIEDVSFKKGKINLNKDKSNGNGNGKDKSEPWNRNKYVVNDGVVDVTKTKIISSTWLVLSLQLNNKRLLRQMNLTSLSSHKL